MDDADLGAVADVDITLHSEDKSENVDSVERSSDIIVSKIKEEEENDELSNQDNEKVKCMICAESSIKRDATLICKSENIFLCNECGRNHKLDDATKQHEIARIQDDKMICDLCLDSSIPGYGFCLDCKVPEVLCFPCFKRHSGKDEFSNHTICTHLDMMKKGGRSKEDALKMSQDEQVDSNTTDEPQRVIFPKETCSNCHEDENFVKYVCSSCKRRLCTDCFSTHQSEDHNVIPIKDFLGNKFPCLTCNLNASFHCHSCNSDYCDECRVDHQAKFLLDHEWIDILSHAFTLRAVSLPLCCKCLVEEQVHVLATSYCISCNSESPLCDACSKEHLQEFASHTLCYVMISFNDEEKVNETEEEAELMPDTAIKCTPCTFDKEVTDATSFCLTCPDHEPMCDNCAGQHIRGRKTRGHEICSDLQKFLSPPQSNIFCKNCNVNGVSRDAVAFCLTCRQPEPSCEDCTKLHLKQSEFCYHKMSYEIQQLTKLILCEPCSYEKTERAATHFCQNCKEPEPMCHTCATEHLKQRFGRGHCLNDNIKEMPGYENITFKVSLSCPAQKLDAKTPGKPMALKILSDVVELFWIKPEETVDYYQIRYKSKGGQEKWKFAETDADYNQITIAGLMANTVYVFQVRGVFQDQEGGYGPANDTVKTEESLATCLLKLSLLVDDGNPPKYQLVTEELKQSRNCSAKTRKLILGNTKTSSEEEKTIMLVGATGSGKSTLVDGIINYVMGVSFDDPFRFTLVQLEEEEKKTHNQAISQTEWITVYKIAPQKGSRLNFTLNIIDTPGFGDTRGIERDQGIINQIRQLFSSKEDKGVLFIDAVCFIVKAPDARLTVSQRYIFSSIMSLFGKDIESIICTLITFGDGAEPPVLASLREANLPFGSTFQFNNSALFAENKNLTTTSLSPMFWEMGCNSFQKFFDQLSHFETKSLIQTKDVLKEREQLKTVIASILPQVKAGLSKIGELRDQLEIFKRHKDDIENNKDFIYEVEETKQFLVDLPRGQHVTNCLQCNVTCHENCAIADDAKKRGCWAMTNGKCRICIGKCIWSDHKNTPYIFKYSLEKVKKTYTEMKKKYEQAKGSKLTHETYIEELTYDVDYLFENVKLMMAEMNRCKSRLKEIALRPDPLSVVEHIELMIEAEETEKQPGFRRRIKILYEFKRMALVDEQVQNFDQNIKSMKDDVKSAVGKTFTGPGRAPNKGKGNIVQRGVRFVRSLFE